MSPKRFLFVALVGGCDCGGEPAPCEPSWTAVLDDEDEDGDDLGCSILSVWGDSRDDLWFAGGSLGVEPSKGCALHLDGERWEVLPIDVPQSFWWVTRTPEGTVWFVGEEGIAVRWDGSEATEFETGVDGTLFGVWGARDDDVWAVGGDGGDGDKDVIVHFDGAAWTRVAAPEPRGALFFKVWGAAADDVWVVGASGLILHWDGDAWSIHTEWTDEYGTTQQLLTVNGRAADDVWAVGSSTTILHYDGDAWTRWRDPTGAPVFGSGLTGVFAPVGGDVCIVGDAGTKLFIPSEGAHLDDTLEGTDADLHGTWCDASGTTFAVGGNYVSPAPSAREAMIAVKGCDVPRAGLP